MVILSHGLAMYEDRIEERRPFYNGSSGDYLHLLQLRVKAALGGKELLLTFIDDDIHRKVTEEAQYIIIVTLSNDPLQIIRD